MISGLTFFLLSFSVQAADFYYTNRTFTAIGFNLQGTPPADILNTESKKLNNIVPGSIKTNSYSAIEKKTAFAWGYTTGTGAWSAVANFSNSPSIYSNQLFDNVGWVRGTKSVTTNWGAFLWTLKNHLDFKSSETDKYAYGSGWVAITNVMVKGLTNYPPMSDQTADWPDVGLAKSNYPGDNQGEEKTFQVDLTTYFQLAIPDIYVSPPEAVAAVGGSAVQFTAVGTNIEYGVAWSIDPSGVTSGATIQAGGYSASVTPGTVPQVYKIRAAVSNCTDFYDEAELTAVGVQSPLQYKIGTNTWANMPDPLFVCKDTTVDFKAIKVPADATWPTNKPVWTFEGQSGGAGMEENSHAFTTVSSSTTDYKLVTAKCGNTVTGKVIVCKVEFGSGFDRVAPTKTQTVSVTTMPSLLPSGVSVSISADRTYGSEGSATPNPSTITCSTNVTVIGGVQSWGSGTNAAPSNMVLVAQLLGCSVTNGTPFTVCAHAINFQQTNSATLSGGVIKFWYAWNSDSDNCSHLNKVWLGEHITYSDNGIHMGTNRPWKGNQDNPTIVPRRWEPLGYPATVGEQDDTHYPPGELPSPGPADSFDATQHYGWRCFRCNPGSVDDTSLEWQQNLLGPITISRFVEQVGTNWQYRIQKSGVTNTAVLTP